MLSPKRTKYRKSFKLKPKGNMVYNDLHFGAYGLKALESGRITNKQTEGGENKTTGGILSVKIIFINANQPRAFYTGQAR